MSGVDLAALRQEYMRETLDVGDIEHDPVVQFRKWFDEAISAQLPMVNAMALATADADCRPSARVVLLKGLDERGFAFYTDYDSRKGAELAANPRAALLFYWTLLEREVRVEGRVEKTSSRESDDYFATRPVGSRLAALASRQSSVIPDRQTLERGYADMQRTHGETPPRPAAWDGYRVVPDQIEFWQERPNRLHDRLLYTQGAGVRWEIVRLAP